MFVAQGNKEAGLVAVGTDDGFGGFSYVNNFAVDGRVSFGKREDTVVFDAVVKFCGIFEFHF